MTETNDMTEFPLPPPQNRTERGKKCCITCTLQSTSSSISQCWSAPMGASSCQHMCSTLSPLCYNASQLRAAVVTLLLWLSSLLLFTCAHVAASCSWRSDPETAFAVAGAGLATGAIGAGILSDKIGRAITARLVFILGFLATVAAVSAHPDDSTSLLILAASSAAASGGGHVAAELLLELIPPSGHAVVLLCYPALFFPVGLVQAGMVAAGWTSTLLLTVAICSVTGLGLLVCNFLPESKLFTNVWLKQEARRVKNAKVHEQLQQKRDQLALEAAIRAQLEEEEESSDILKRGVGPTSSTTTIIIRAGGGGSSNDALGREKEGEEQEEVADDHHIALDGIGNSSSSSAIPLGFGLHEEIHRLHTKVPYGRRHPQQQQTTNNNSTLYNKIWHAIRKGCRILKSSQQRGTLTTEKTTTRVSLFTRQQQRKSHHQHHQHHGSGFTCTRGHVVLATLWFLFTIAYYLSSLTLLVIPPIPSSHSLSTDSWYANLCSGSAETKNNNNNVVRGDSSTPTPSSSSSSSSNTPCDPSATTITNHDSVMASMFRSGAHLVAAEIVAVVAVAVLAYSKRGVVSTKMLAVIFGASAAALVLAAATHPSTASSSSSSATAAASSSSSDCTAIALADTGATAGRIAIEFLSRLSLAACAQSLFLYTLESFSAAIRSTVAGAAIAIFRVGALVTLANGIALDGNASIEGEGGRLQWSLYALSYEAGIFGFSPDTAAHTTAAAAILAACAQLCLVCAFVAACLPPSFMRNYNNRKTGDSGRGGNVRLSRQQQRRIGGRIDSDADDADEEAGQKQKQNRERKTKKGETMRLPQQQQQHGIKDEDAVNSNSASTTISAAVDTVILPAMVKRAVETFGSGVGNLTLSSSAARSSSSSSSSSQRYSRVAASENTDDSYSTTIATSAAPSATTTGQSKGVSALNADDEDNDYDEEDVSSDETDISDIDDDDDGEDEWEAADLRTHDEMQRQNLGKSSTRYFPRTNGYARIIGHTAPDSAGHVYDEQDVDDDDEDEDELEVHDANTSNSKKKSHHKHNPQSSTSTVLTAPEHNSSFFARIFRSQPKPFTPLPELLEHGTRSSGNVIPSATTSTSSAARGRGRTESLLDDGLARFSLRAYLDGIATCRDPVAAVRAATLLEKRAWKRHTISKHNTTNGKHGSGSTTTTSSSSTTTTSSSSTTTTSSSNTNAPSATASLVDTAGMSDQQLREEAARLRVLARLWTMKT